MGLRPEDQAAEVTRLEALGACRVSVGQGNGVSWVAMADPEGNEFDVLRPRTAEELAGDEQGVSHRSWPAVTGYRSASCDWAAGHPGHRGHSYRGNRGLRSAVIRERNAAGLAEPLVQARGEELQNRLQPGGGSDPGRPVREYE